MWVYQPPTPYTDMYLYLVDDESDEKPKRVLHLQFRQQYDTHTRARTHTPPKQRSSSTKSLCAGESLFCVRTFLPMFIHHLIRGSDVPMARMLSRYTELDVEPGKGYRLVAGAWCASLALAPLPLICLIQI